MSDIHARVRGIEDMRGRVRALYENCLGNERHAKALELCTLNAVREEALLRKIAPYWDNHSFRALYSVKARSMLFNLDNPETPHLKQTLLAAKDIEPFRKLVRMTHAEMHPELWQPHFDRHNRKQPSVPEGQIQCSKCKSWRCSFSMVQTRSADEPSTLFCFCNGCGKRWKASA